MKVFHLVLVSIQISHDILSLVTTLTELFWFPSMLDAYLIIRLQMLPSHSLKIHINYSAIATISKRVVEHVTNNGNIYTTSPSRMFWYVINTNHIIKEHQMSQ